MKRHVRILSGMFLLLVACFLLLVACMDQNGDGLPPTPPIETDAGGFSLHVTYDSIRSYPGGGGVFTIYAVPDDDFAGSIRLEVDADQQLHAALDHHIIDDAESVTELRLHPEASIDVGVRVLTVRATHNNRQVELKLIADVRFWAQSDEGIEMEKRAQFLDWLSREHPELGEIGLQPFHRYKTYTQILVVEHWTFLSTAWDMRVCFHVMIPPHDWAMMQLRRTGTLTPLLAARRASDGSIEEMPVSEYPTLFNY